MFYRIISSFIALILSLSPWFITPEKKCEAEFKGTFIQSWMCIWWSDERWQDEMEYMKDAGIEYLVLPDMAVRLANGSWEIYYPSELDAFSDAVKYGDVVEATLRNCSKNGIKVFIGLAMYDEWWVQAGLTSEYGEICTLMSDIQKEIYNKYYSRYSDTFYGWYFIPEIFNSTTMKLSICSIADGLNKVIDTATELNPNMPMLMSPYFTEHLAVPSVISALTMWQTFMQKVHFRDGDIFCPQDAIGSGWVKKSNLEKVWKMFSAAVESCPKDIKLWANCENMTVARPKYAFMLPETIEKVNAPATLDRFVWQMEVASHYVENIITFSFNHYYSPGESNRAYYDTYIDYLNNSHKLEQVPPSAPSDVQIRDGVLSWLPSTDNIGIAYYVILENDKKVARVEGNAKLEYQVTDGNSYSVMAFDGAGNSSMQINAQR